MGFDGCSVAEGPWFASTIPVRPPPGRVPCDLGGGAGRDQPVDGIAGASPVGAVRRAGFRKVFNG